MYNITEIKYQNQQDCMSLLFMHLARSLVDYCGRGAEGTVREAVRRMGRNWGGDIRKKHVDAGVKTNLKSLYNTGLEYLEDPRMYGELLEEKEEVRLWEVRTCPLADVWNKAGEGALGLWYCEEFQRGLIDGYTQGKGQMNQSTFLTCPRDNHCRFSAYYRAANIDGDQHRESFSTPGAGEVSPDSGALRDVDFAEGIRVQFVKIYYYLLEAAEERHGGEGVCAVAAGLRRLAEELTPVMRRHAENTLNPCDEEFLKLNFPVALDTAKEEIWARYGGHDAPKLMQINLLDRLKKGLALADAAAAESVA